MDTAIAHLIKFVAEVQTSSSLQYLTHSHHQSN